MASFHLGPMEHWESSLYSAAAPVSGLMATNLNWGQNRSGMVVTRVLRLGPTPRSCAGGVGWRTPSVGAWCFLVSLWAPLEVIQGPCCGAWFDHLWWCAGGECHSTGVVPLAGGGLQVANKGLSGRVQEQCFEVFQSGS
jgi:hypothetical protein